MSVDSIKKDWVLTEACFCGNSYCLFSGFDACCMSEFASCCCLGGDSACIPVPENIPKTCGLCFLMVYPTVGCCKTLDDLFEEEELAKYHKIKRGKTMVGGCCLGPVLARNVFCFTPAVLCSDEGSNTCCIGQDCALPCATPSRWLSACAGSFATRSSLAANRSRK